MVSRTRIAAATCLLASGLLIGGVGTATAGADPGASTSEDSAEQPARPHGTTKRSVDRGEDADPPAAPDPVPDEGDPPTKGEEPPTKGDDGDDEGETPRPPCCEEGDEDCGPGWPWPWPPEPPIPFDPPTDDKDSDRPPVGSPPSLPQGPLVGGADKPDIIDVVPGVDIGAADIRTAPISVPVVGAAPPLSISPAVSPGVGPAAGSGAGARGAGGSPSTLPTGPRQVSTSPPPARQPLPAAAGTSATIPTAGSRVGYGEYLRSAGISQIAVLALPGLAGILVLTGAGGLVGYRQAKAGQGVRSSGITRFMN
ncbi:hypothetical protein [Mycobacterium sp. 236(2023)]|uniref:hypothetical protein n=1 Tax=Mycobacterium sp. 236(2023) TaxID=3038163 RepID=UPI0024152E45|nr:hypothetical protein [Mycobacterium sp. 236(2023)]MDG4668366.1 hypothetical protein [Mycobacterium sp. 236(2023)]